MASDKLLFTYQCTNCNKLVIPGTCLCFKPLHISVNTDKLVCCKCETLDLDLKRSFYEQILSDKKWICDRKCIQSINTRDSTSREFDDLILEKVNDDVREKYKNLTTK